MNPINPSDTNHPASYSTILQCSQDGFTCFLRAVQGLVSLGMFLIFLRGYRAITNENNNPITKQDKNIYILAMAQTLALTLYYFLFEEFFVLATIRNILIWISINLFGLYCKIYWMSNQLALRRVNWAINFLKVCNFLLWFLIAVSDGSELVNTSFNLGYNCLIMDWVVLSGLLLIVAMFMTGIVYLIVQRLSWELQQERVKNDPKQQQSLTEQRQNIILLTGGSIVGAFIMFVWDYLAYSVSQQDQDCVTIFSGNSFFRKALCFLLKIFTMQVVPSIVYYIFYYKKKADFLLPQKEQQDFDHIDYLCDETASELNRSLSSRVDSRRSLFSGKSTGNL